MNLHLPLQVPCTRHLPATIATYSASRWSQTSGPRPFQSNILKVPPNRHAAQQLLPCLPSSRSENASCSPSGPGGLDVRTRGEPTSAWGKGCPCIPSADIRRPPGTDEQAAGVGLTWALGSWGHWCGAQTGCWRAVWGIWKASCRLQRKLADYCRGFLSNSLWRENNSSVDGAYRPHKDGDQGHDPGARHSRGCATGANEQSPH